MNRRSVIAGAFSAAIASPSSAYAAGARPQAAHAFNMGGEEFLLTDIISPAIPPNGEAEPYAHAALEVQKRLLAGAGIDVSGMTARDRWDRRVGVARLQRTDDEPASLQLSLVQAGAARVAPQSEAFDLILSLLEAEDEARRATRGLWALDAYAAIDANVANHRISPAFHIVQGRVVSATLRSGRLYLNFGADYQTDFTASLLARTMKQWRMPINPDIVIGRTIEVRGHVGFYNGPSLELTHEMQVRFRGEGNPS